MAKDKKDAKQAPAQAPATEKEVTIDNAMELIKSGNVVKDNEAQEAAEKIAKEKHDDKVQRMVGAIQRSEYTNLLSVLFMRHERNRAKAAKKYADATRSLLNDLKAGKYTYNEWDKEREKIYKDFTDGLDDADKQYQNERKELNDNFRTACGTWDERWQFDRATGRGV